MVVGFTTAAREYDGRIAAISSVANGTGIDLSATFKPHAAGTRLVRQMLRMTKQLPSLSKRGIFVFLFLEPLNRNKMGANFQVRGWLPVNRP